MNRSFLATCGLAAIALGGPARAQSLGDAINAALAPDAGGQNCAALGAGVGRVTDVWQWVDNSPLPDTIQVTNGDTGGVTIASPPLDVPDGAGGLFSVRRSTPVTLDPAVATAMTEEEFFAFFRQTGVQRVVISRFASGAFGSGLSGVCGTVVEARTNSNGNTAGAGGFAGGSSSASGRSISSLSSAREQSSKAKKRKRKRDDRSSSYQDGYVRLASADGGVGLIADAAGVGPFGVQTFIDLRGGYSDIDRDATALEGGFEGRSVFGQGSITAVLSENFAMAGSFAYQRSKGEFDAANASGGANEFSENSYTGSAFLIASFPFSTLANGAPLSLDFAAGGFYGGGDGEIERTFTTMRQVTYAVEVIGGTPGTPVPFVRQQLISDDLSGSYDTRNYGFSAAASLSFDLGAFIATPGVEFTYFNFRQDPYDESVNDTFNNGLALSYDKFKDKWTESRIGGALSRDFGGFRIEGYGDLVLTGGAATPTRTATFAEDLRANPYVISYQVDDLDKAFGVFGLVAAADLADGIEAFIGGETTAGHDYLRTRTIYAGLRFTP